MKGAFWLLFLFALAVALALVAGNNQGMVTLFWPPHRIDVSVNLAALLLALFVLVVHLALRALSALWRLPEQARQWRALRQERLAYAALREALALSLSGRFLKSQKAAEQVLTHTGDLQAHAPEQALAPAEAAQMQVLARLIAAESAHALRDRAARDAHLQAVLRTGAGPQGAVGDSAKEGARIRAARWAVDDREPEQALQLLDALPLGVQRRTLVLRVRLKAARLARQSGQALESARLLSRHGGLSADAAATLVRSLATETLYQAHDTAQLRRAWDSLDPSERAQPELVARVCERWLDLRGDASQARLWLWPLWQRLVSGELRLSDAQSVALVRVIERSLDAVDPQWLGSIEALQRAQPANANWQYLAGVAYSQRELWGKAHQLLKQAVLGLQDTGLRRGAWRALAHLAEQRGDAQAASEAWKQAGSA
jgi:HemY protein